MKKINSAGVLFIHLIGTIIDKDRIRIHQVNSYQNGFNFYNDSIDLDEKISDKDIVKLFCIIGAKKKADKITECISQKIKKNYHNILDGYEPLLENNDLDQLSGDFNRLIHEYIFSDEIKYVRKHRISQGEWVMDYFWCGENPDDDSYLLTDDIVESWLSLEKPVLMGKQIMIQSFQLADLKGRKVVGVFPDSLNGEWILILEGGYQLKLNSDFPYMREKAGVRELEMFTIGDIDTITNNPVYAYGKWLNPTEIYEEWHKVFLYAAALQDYEWTEKSLAKSFEKFLDFMEKNICDIMLAEPMITKKQYHQILYLNVMKLKNFIKGKEEQVVSKELWQLLNSRYVYLPYIYKMLGTPSKDNNIKFDLNIFKQKLKLLESDNSYQKGVSLEEVASYFIDNIEGLKITGNRIKTGTEEIDLSTINISLDKDLWEMGAYILIECKNWHEKVGIQVIRGLSHISELKGNKTTILFSANGLTSQADQEILRTALNGRFILSITKEELYNLKTKDDCYNLLILKWRQLQNRVESELNI